MGSVPGVCAVVEDTLSTQYQFPDRLLLGEDVIWSGLPARGLLSSHRLMMTQTHCGFGGLGAPTGRSLQFGAIADCAAQGNQIYEDWLVVDQAAAALQAGLIHAISAGTWPRPTRRPGRLRPPGIQRRPNRARHAQAAG